MIDLNKDGIADFKFSFYGMNYDHSVINSIHVDPLTGGQVVGTAAGQHGPYASALVRGANIGPSAHFVSGKNHKVLLERFYGFESGILSSSSQGKWNNLGPDRFVGVKFTIHGATHYGWVRVTLKVIPVDGVSGTVTAYAYETVPNKKIVVGISKDAAVTSPTTSVHPGAGAALGMLASGADGLDIWRRESAGGGN